MHSRPSQRLADLPRLKNSGFPTIRLIALGVENKFIHAIQENINAKLNANNLVQELNLVCQAHSLWRNRFNCKGKQITFKLNNFELEFSQRDVYDFILGYYL